MSVWQCSHATLLQHAQQYANQQHNDCAASRNAKALDPLHPRTDTLVSKRTDLLVSVKLGLRFVDGVHFVSLI